MIDKNSTPEQIAAYKTDAMSRFIPAVAHLDEASARLIRVRAEAEGWSASQAEWLDRLAKAPLIQAVVDGTPAPEALEQAYAQARRDLTIAYFDNALAEGKTLFAAFLTLIELERQLAERRGEAAPDYADNILLAACEAVQVAAERGLSSEDQVSAGFGMIRKLVAARGN
ncbi:hypothetical protein [Bosea sp. (in: a-proteobacteria)]|uniref:hypothetical protein n=1 Tax=Bosea sp. (in: a-proteobacteria) TaxID=1871050 RepID=UPI0026184D85|nr:hypothetical protein [Bosea sp. (in: a-proteobacteria)]MCO5089501.1 hypothetical protein [Bosea sp. (in: a-proteobacteria)]